MINKKRIIELVKNIIQDPENHVRCTDYLWMIMDKENHVIVAFKRINSSAYPLFFNKQSNLSPFYISASENRILRQIAETKFFNQNKINSNDYKKDGNFSSISQVILYLDNFVESK